MVVRFTNKDVITQLVYSQLSGDVVVSSAYSHELPRYGITVGLTNYASTYATGLLLARRLLQKLGLAELYKGTAEVKGEEFHVKAVDEGRRPFKALLDVGLSRTTTGSKVFAALKGAADGGLDIPHNAKRFVGFDKEKLKSDVLRTHILGGHVARYMKVLKEKGDGSFEKHFSKYVAAGVGSDDIQKIYTKAHAAIRADPSFQKKAQKENPDRSHKKKRPGKISYAQRQNRIKQILEARAKKAAE